MGFTVYVQFHYSSNGVHNACALHDIYRYADNASLGAALRLTTSANSEFALGDALSSVVTMP